MNYYLWHLFDEMVIEGAHLNVVGLMLTWYFIRFALDL
jgi:hypothetical protein